MPNNLVSRTPWDLIQYTLVSTTPGDLIQYTLVSTTPGDLLICSPCPKFVLTCVTKN